MTSRCGGRFPNDGRVLYLDRGKEKAVFLVKLAGYEDYMSSSNNLYTFYRYDQGGRLTKVYTGKYSSGSDTTKDAEYQYTASDKIRELKLGASPAQILTYIYNERDWLQQMSSAKFSLKLGYNTLTDIGGSSLFGIRKAQYNGNVSWLTYQMAGIEYTDYWGDPTDIVGYVFAYDNADRLLQAQWGWNGYSFEYEDYGWWPTTSYKESITYDASGAGIGNGNINSIQRWNGVSGVQDNISYVYGNANNQLSSISINGQTKTYTYDGNGNVSKDDLNSVTFIIYDIFNLPVKIYKTNDLCLYLNYDANGNRVRKLYNGVDQYYATGSDSKTHVITTLNSNYPVYNIYGNDLIGQIKQTFNGEAIIRTKYYYLKDHLGSIRMTINSSGSMVSYDDYYPFGLVMSGRSGTGVADTRYKFTSKERDSETGYDYFGERYYDSRIGRWIAMDPLAEKYLSMSPYVHAGNNPLTYIDPNGKEIRLFQNIAGNKAFNAAWSVFMETQKGRELFNTLHSGDHGDVFVLLHLGSGQDFSGAMCLPKGKTVSGMMELTIEVARDVSQKAVLRTKGNRSIYQVAIDPDDFDRSSVRDNAVRIAEELKHVLYYEEGMPSTDENGKDLHHDAMGMVNETDGEHRKTVIDRRKKTSWMLDYEKQVNEIIQKQSTQSISK